MSYRAGLVTALAVALLTPCAEARGHGGSHHGMGRHYSHSYVTKKGVYHSGSVKHYPKKHG